MPSLQTPIAAMSDSWICVMEKDLTFVNVSHRFFVGSHSPPVAAGFVHDNVTQQCMKPVFIIFMLWV